MAPSVDPADPVVSPKSHEALNGAIHVELTPHRLDVSVAMARVKHPSAGAIVIFAGT